MVKKGIVTKCVGGKFTVFDGERDFVCFSPKKLRHNTDDAIVGDKVEFEVLSENTGNVTCVLPRKNKLLRPQIANVDVVFLVLASQPQPDFFLADKVLVNCFKQVITPVVVVNKTDLDTCTYEQAKADYSSICDVVAVSAHDVKTLDVLKPYFDGKTVCLAGQSAVGKTSLMNAFLPQKDAETGGLSAKTGRGMHTTRTSSVNPCYSGFLVDTCGFSLCDVDGITSSDLRLYFDDVVELSEKCRFKSCSHTAEPDCAVKKAVGQGNFSSRRYERYVAEYNELKQLEKNKY